MTAAESTADWCNATIAAICPPITRIGIRVVEISASRVVGQVPFEGNVNHYGAMYAGTTFSLAEMLGGALALVAFDRDRYYLTVKDVDIRFRRPATSGLRAEAVLDPELATQVVDATDAVGKGDFELVATVTDDADEVVAITRSTYQLRRVSELGDLRRMER